MLNARTTRRLLISSALALSALGVIEIVLRVAGFQRPPVDIPLIVWNSDEDKLMQGDTSLFQEDEHSLWSPRPGALIQFAATGRIAEEERINAAGDLGGLVARERTQGVLRIVTLGDSSTFGVGVPQPPSLSASFARVRASEAERCGVVGYLTPCPG